MKRVVMISGGFDPITEGHIALIKSAAKYGDVVVALNSNDWLMRKKGYVFMQFEGRRKILRAIRGVVEVIGFDDTDGTARAAIRTIRPDIFANGGDRNRTNTPEDATCSDLGVFLIWGCGGMDKPTSSSKLVRAASDLLRTKDSVPSERVKRPWGSFRLLEHGCSHWVKTLQVDCGGFLSMQQHEGRGELWQVIKGRAKVKLGGRGPLPRKGWRWLGEGQYLFIPAGQWHQLINESKTEQLTVIEIATGHCEETDIIRDGPNGNLYE